jgi:release factor glutamine methyltransferase
LRSSGIENQLLSFKRELVKKLLAMGLETGEASAEADIITAEVTGLTATEQIIFPGPFLEKWNKVAADILEQREKHVPLQYIVGYTEFMGLKFKVEPGVFIPRSDTEALVETVMEIVRKEKISAPYIMDIGTGSGAVGVALAKRIEGARVLAVEIEETPFRIAKKNAELHKVADRVQFVHGDWRENVPLDLDIIVSNPPYIPRSQEASLAPEVGKHEPHRALFGSDEDGLGYYRELARSTRSAFNKLDGGWIACEFGDGQASDCLAIFKNEGWFEVSVKADLSGSPRVISARATQRFY